MPGIAKLPAPALAALASINTFLLQAGLSTSSQTLVLELAARLPTPNKRDKLHILLMEALRPSQSESPSQSGSSEDEEEEKPTKIRREPKKESPGNSKNVPTRERGDIIHKDMRDKQKMSKCNQSSDETEEEEEEQSHTEEQNRIKNNKTRCDSHKGCQSDLLPDKDNRGKDAAWLQSHSSSRPGKKSSDSKGHDSSVCKQQDANNPNQTAAGTRTKNVSRSIDQAAVAPQATADAHRGKPVIGSTERSCRGAQNCASILRGMQEGGGHKRQTMDKFVYGGATPIAYLKGHRQALTTLSYLRVPSLGSTSSSFLFSSSRDNYMRLWGYPKGQLGTPECIAMSRGPEGMNKALPLVGGSIACVCADGGKLMTVDISNGRAIDDMRWNDGLDNFTALAVHENSSRTLVAVAEKESCVCLWDTRMKDPSMKLQRSKTIKGLATDLIFSDSGDMLVCNGSSSTVLWDIRNQQISNTIQTRDSAGHVPCSIHLLTSTSNLLCTYKSAHTGRHSPPPPMHHRLYPLCGGDVVLEYPSLYGNVLYDGSLVDAQVAVSPRSNDLILQPVQGGRLSITRTLTGQHMCTTSPVTSETNGVPLAASVPPIRNVTWNPWTATCATDDVIGNSFWATADATGKIAVWGRE